MIFFLNQHISTAVCHSFFYVGIILTNIKLLRYIESIIKYLSIKFSSITQQKQNSNISSNRFTTQKYFSKDCSTQAYVL